MWNIFCKDLWECFDSLSAYLAMAAFSLTSGLMLWVFPETNILAYGYADMGLFFGFMPYVFLLLIPALCMRSLAEERRKRTLELLLSLPVTEGGLVIAKYSALLSVALACLLPSLIYVVSLYALGDPKGNLDGAAIAGGYIGLVLLSSTYTAIGILFSAICRQPLVAFVLTTSSCLAAFVGLSPMRTLTQWDQYAWETFSLMYPYQSIQKGWIQAQDISFFLGLNVLLLVLATYIVHHRR